MVNVDNFLNKVLLFVTNGVNLNLTRRKGDQMNYVELFKYTNGDSLMVAGHLSKEEIKFYFKKGYKKKKNRNENKNGIRRG